MERIFTQFANADPAVQAETNIFTSLGLDWKLLVLQTLAFLLLLWLLKKFVYPPILAMLDKRDAAVKASADAAMEAERYAAEAEARTAELLDEAKHEAAAIVATGEAAKYIVPHCGRNMFLDENLLLKGLKLIYEKNQK